MTYLCLKPKLLFTPESLCNFPTHTHTHFLGPVRGLEMQATFGQALFGR